MASFDLHEQEQLTQLKYFWRDWGKYVIGVLLLILIGYISSVAADMRAEKKANQAAIVYSQLTDALALSDNKSVYKIASQMEINYPKVEYTSMATMLAAKQAFTEKNLILAANYLSWTINHSNDKGLVALATLRLADVYIDQKHFDKALDILTSNHNDAFSVLVYSKRGDLYVAKGELDRARDAYKEALQRAGQDSNITNGIQLKLDALGN